MSELSDYLTTSNVRLDARSALQAAPGVLLGVTPAAEAALKTLGVRTVFDLATSKIFSDADRLLRAGEDPTDAIARFGVAPADVIEGTAGGVRVDELRFQGLRVLEGIGPAKAAAVEQALCVRTVRDLALWPPYRAARAIMQTAFSPDSLRGSDPELPSELLPKFGEYATERVFYRTLVLDQIGAPPDTLRPIEDAGPIDLTPAAGQDFGFQRLGFGALMRFAQSWYSHGTALGQLLHSVALAPGESTRIAMVDWSRRELGAQTETGEEAQSLTNMTQHNRAISEVTSAVANESQSGFSRAASVSTAKQSGSGGGVSLGPISFGGSEASSTNTSDALSFSSSSGQRDLSASMAQNVSDSTQQNASAVRSRRASVIREVSQEEHEKISTRVITNYNHMHALSIQYYEVVQVYRVETRLWDIDPCLFIPMSRIDFKNAGIVARFRSVLLDAALDKTTRELLEGGLETAKITTTMPERMSTNSNAIPTIVEDEGRTVLITDEAQLTGFYLMGNNPAPVEGDVIVYVERRDGAREEVVRTDNQNIKLSTRVPLRELKTISIVNNKDFEYAFTPALQLYNGSYAMSLNVPVKLAKSTAPQPIVQISGGGTIEQLATRLEANQLYYSQAIFRSLDAATLALLLAPYRYGQRPLSQVVDPLPVTVAGNYLVFRMHVRPAVDRGTEDEQAWARWLTEHGIRFEDVKTDLVPLPSGGVFAEAVLGRCNSSEKLDITRFWNWQDSPIPITAPDIAPLQAGSRAQPTDLKPGQFGPPLVSIVNPTSLPDPTPLAATLSAIASGNMFRDMSGLAATVGLAQAGLAAASEGATSAATQAGANLATAAKKEVEMFKAALAFAGSVLGRGAPDTSPSTISNEGAKINHGRSLDQRERGLLGAAGAGASSPGVNPGAGGSGGRSGGGQSGGAVPGLGVASAGGYEGDAFRRAVWGDPGEPSASAARGLLQLASNVTSGGRDETEDSPYTRSRDYYTLKAYTNAFGNKDDSWNPSLGYLANRARIVKLYAYYRDTYLARPDRFLWAGLGRLAGGAVLGGLDLLVGGISNHRDPSFLTNTMVRIGKAIFLDLAWLHEAYLDDPQKAVQLAAEHDRHVDAKASYGDAWKKIGSGTAAAIAEGNRMLLMNEQYSIIQPFYDALRQDFDSRGTVQSTRAFTRNVHPYHRDFLTAFPTRDVLLANDRWAWIIEPDGMWEKWVVMPPEERTRLVTLSMDDILHQDWGTVMPSLLPPGSQ